MVATADGVATVPGFPVRVVDTNGAGDAHAGAFLAGLATGLSDATLQPFIDNMHTALWVLAATSVVGAVVSLLRPSHVREA